MEPTGHLVPLAAELASSVEEGQHHLSRRQVVVLVVLANRNSPTVVGHLAAIVVPEGDIDGRTVSGHRLVHRVVDDLPNKVVEPGRTGRSDVHPRPLSDSL